MILFVGVVLQKNELQLNDGLSCIQRRAERRTCRNNLKIHFDKVEKKRKSFYSMQTVPKMTRDLQKAYILRAILRYTSARLHFHPAIGFYFTTLSSLCTVYNV